ncbi:MAG: DUF4019 domain-containing protein [Endomicrobia bacterium]|nr:DUF4019 domain-containing protein [Endomicrobiia bacterium]MCL2506967.1 DUF4019 domain-containing protein [Endomicrobiia bacterium]
MKKYLLVLMCVVMAGIFAGCSCSKSKNEVADVPSHINVKEVRAASLAWLAKLDNGWFMQAYDELAGFAKERITSEQWQNDMTTFRRPLGSSNSRKEIFAFYQSEFPDAPKGDFIVIQYGTLFEAAPRSVVVESVTLMKQEDGRWSVSGYFMK